MKRISFLLVVVLGASLALAACGGGSTVSLELSDSGLTPNTLTVPVGAKVTFSVKNTATTEDDCSFRDLSTIKLDPAEFYWELDQIAAGSTKSGTFAAPSQPASFQVACGVTPFDPVTGFAGAKVATLVVK